MAQKVTEQIQILVNSENIDTKSAVALLLAAHAELIEKQDDIVDRLEIISRQITEMVVSTDKRIGSLEKRIDALEAYQQAHPSLLWLARFKTRETVVAMVLIFVILSLWYVSGLRQPILQFLGIPPF